MYETKRMRREIPGAEGSSTRISCLYKTVTRVSISVEIYVRFHSTPNVHASIRRVKNKRTQHVNNISQWNPLQAYDITHLTH